MCVSCVCARCVPHILIQGHSIIIFMVILYGPTWGPQSPACTIWQWPEPPLTPVGLSAQGQLSFPLPIPAILVTFSYCLALMPASPWLFPPGPLPP